MELNRKNNYDCFPHYRGIFCLMSTVSHLTEMFRYHNGANWVGDQLFQQILYNKNEAFIWNQDVAT